MSLYPVSLVAPAAPAQEAVVATATQAPAAQSAPTWTTISRSGEVMSKLQSLAESDPSKLQAALTHVSADLQASAQTATGAKADALNDLADRFAQAASSGDLSALARSSHHHHRAQAPAAVDATASAPATASSVTGSTSATGKSSSSDAAARAMLPNVLAQMDAAMGYNPPPFGPWFTSD